MQSQLVVPSPVGTTPTNREQEQNLDQGQDQVGPGDQQDADEGNKSSCLQLNSILRPYLFLAIVCVVFVIMGTGYGIFWMIQAEPTPPENGNVHLNSRSRIVVVSSQVPNQTQSQTTMQVPGEECYRNCSADPKTRKTCIFEWKIEDYVGLSSSCFLCGVNNTKDCSRRHCIPLDRSNRSLAVVNRLLPGPSIRVCHNDEVIVDLENELVAQVTGIHWHGQDQRDSYYMDGVPHVSQCPIQPGAFFRYTFRAQNPGTHFWHSHAGTQRADGVFGSFIVRREASKEPHGPSNGNLYQYDLPEHELIVMDWLDEPGLSLFLEGRNRPYSNHVRQILLNGRGLPVGFTVEDGENLNTTSKYFVPLHQVRIQSGFSYRWRVISNGVTACPIQFSVDNHTMVVIASDGHDLDPIKASSFVIHAGERYDVVVTASQPASSYWIKVRGLLNCNGTKAFNLGVLQYDNVPVDSYPETVIPTWDEAGAPTDSLQINPANVAPGLPGISKTVVELSSVWGSDDDPEITAREKPDAQFYLSFDFNTLHNYDFEKLISMEREDARPINFTVPQINHITNVLPPFPPLAQPDRLHLTSLCNETSVQKRNCKVKLCLCTHWIKLEYASIVELVLVDRGYAANVSHPFHLHGHSFRVVAMGKLGTSTEPEHVKILDMKGGIPRRRGRAVIKDTVSVPDGGYTIIRFRANNRGVWLFHCHLEFHAEAGMGLLFQVGEMSRMPKPPRAFPRCDHFRPQPVSGSSPQLPHCYTWNSYLVALSLVLQLI